MAPEADGRYRDVETLAEDVRRFMTGECVSVHEESIVERSFRWCGRHRALASTIAIAVTALMIVSVISTGVIRRAHRAEQQAKIEARKAHLQALERLVDARDTADTWLVDLSGALQFHPAMTPLRDELIGQALVRYERLLDQPIAPIFVQPVDGKVDQEFETNALLWLERAKCHLRLGDLKRMRNHGDQSKAHYSDAENILAKLGKSIAPINIVSRHAAFGDAQLADDWYLRTPGLEDLLKVEQINAAIGKCLVTASPPTLADSIRFREQLERWIPWEPPSKPQQRPTPFISRVISAMVRLELVIERTQTETPANSRRIFSSERYQNAVRWAHWLASQRGEPSDLKLFETVATENAERIDRLGDYSSSHQAWTLLIDELSDRLASGRDRPDWMQSLAHAKLRRAEASVHLGHADEAAEDYTGAINDLNESWMLADADDFYRVNLATAENNLGRLWSRGNDEQQSRARQLFARSIATYQQLLSESATPDILRRLAQTHIASAEAMTQQPVDSVSAEDQRKHYENAQLAYEILRDQGLLTDEDRLDWATTFIRIGKLNGSEADVERINTLLEQIDEQSLSAKSRNRYRALAGSGASN